MGDVKFRLAIILWVTGCVAFIGCAAQRSGILRNELVSLRVVGNEPFTHLVATLSDGQEYNISTDSPNFAQLWKLQGQQILILKGYIQLTARGKTLVVEQFEIPHQ